MDIYTSEWKLARPGCRISRLEAGLDEVWNGGGGGEGAKGIPDNTIHQSHPSTSDNLEMARAQGKTGQRE